MGRTLHFQQIADSRCKENKALLFRLVQDTVEALSQLPGVFAQIGQPRELTFPPESQDTNPITQWRVAFHVTKDRRTTWDQIYEAVNQVRPAYYSFLK